jgi:hypothetical protein
MDKYSTDIKSVLSILKENKIKMSQCRVCLKIPENKILYRCIKCERNVCSDCNTIHFIYQIDDYRRWCKICEPLTN